MCIWICLWFESMDSIQKWETVWIGLGEKLVQFGLVWTLANKVWFDLVSMMDMRSYSLGWI